jgi:ELWxxDGT repeat protein
MTRRTLQMHEAKKHIRHQTRFRPQVERLEDRVTPSAVLVKDIWPGVLGSNPQGITDVNGTIFFAANDGTHGKELWMSDGTEAGTVLVKDINPGSSDSIPYTPAMAAVNGTLFFSANSPKIGFELWKSDGTANGTVLVKDINPATGYGAISSYPHDLTAVGNTLFFSATDGASGVELWKSDGTANGTVLVKDIFPGGFSSSPNYLTAVGNTLFFVAIDPTHGQELWKSDGTADGTVLVKDINPGPFNSYIRYMTNVNGTLFFTANDGFHGTELWKSDGTDAGTNLVKDIWPGINGSFPRNLTNVNGTLFFSADDSIHGSELWKSDGTSDGTVLVKDINPGSASSGAYATKWANVNGTLFFIANDGQHGVELWKSDGTEAGTVLVRDISPGKYYSSFPDDLTAAGGLLVFTADQRDHNTDTGRQVWVSDGTAAGTAMLADINPFGSSYPAYITDSGGTVFFSARDFNAHGQELWKATFPIAGIAGPTDGVRYQPRFFQVGGLDPVPISSLTID